MNNEISNFYFFFFFFLIQGGGGGGDFDIDQASEGLWKKEREVILIHCVPINGITFLLGRTVSHLQRREAVSSASLPPYCPASTNKVALTAGLAH